MSFNPDKKVVETSPFANDQGHKARFIGASGTATAGQLTNIDLPITEYRAINGIQLVLKGHKTGDKASFQVVYGGQVVSEFGKDWYFGETSDAQFPIVLPIKAAILPTMVLRVAYTSTGADDVEVFINYHLYEVTNS